MAARTRSPLKEPPLRVAGQSLDERLNDTLLDDVAPWLYTAAFAVLVAFLEWHRFFYERPPLPKTFTIIALAVAVFAAYRIVTARKRIRALRQGRDGERSVAEMLQQLVAAGWRVFHDVPGDGFNIDHVAIGPEGVFALETKTRSKPLGRNPKILVDESGVSIGSHRVGWQHVEQAQRQADWLSKMLRASTGYAYAARPVVLYPNWFINDLRSRKSPWILGCAEMPGWIAREKRVLSEEQIALASQRIDRHCRGERRGEAIRA